MSEVVFLLDVDNTLLDNDRAKAALDAALRGALPPAMVERFWELYETVRREEDVVDYPATLVRLERESAGAARRIADLVDALDFRACLFPGALEVVQRLWAIGTPVVLSDGDPRFQLMKIERSGLAEAVHGNVRVYVHKEEHLAEVARDFPAERYVLVDDKARVLGEVKARWGERVRTVHVLQGHYADVPVPADLPRPDRTIAAIGDLVATAVLGA